MIVPRQRATQGVQRTPRRDPEAATRASRALRAYQRTRSYEEAAKEAGYADRASAYNAIQRELHRIVEPDVEELRATILADYNKLREAIWLSAIGNPDAPDPDEEDDMDTAKAKRRAKRPNLFAVDRVLEITRDVRKMLGVDVMQQAISTPPTIIISDAMAAAIDGVTQGVTQGPPALPEGKA